MKNLIKKFFTIFMKIWELVKAIVLFIVEIVIFFFTIIKYLRKKISQQNDSRRRVINISLIGLFFVLLSSAFFHFSNKDGSKEDEIENTKNKENIFGIDISHFQGDIDWKTLKNQKKHPIKFVFVRATMGKNRKDKKFDFNFKKSKESGFITGAYHYYDPNENSTQQAKNFIETVKLNNGDFRPVLDIEAIPNKKIQSMSNLKKGLKNWLKIVEKEYGVKPIIYSGYSYWKDNLSKEFSEYPLWVAAYSGKKRNDPLVKNAEIHQFAECVSVPGIKGNKNVDGNDIKKNKLTKLIIKK